MKLACVAMLLMAAASGAFCSVRYDFELTPGLPYLQAPVSFGFTVTDYLTPGPFTIDPFDVTFGLWGPGQPNAPFETFTITKGFLGQSTIFFCFSFGSADADVVSCGAYPGTAGGAGFAGGFVGPVPTAPYAINALAPIASFGSTRALVGLHVSVTEVSSVPEPGTAAMTAFAALFLLSARRVWILFAGSWRLRGSWCEPGHLGS